MKRLFMLAIAAFLFSSVSFAQDEKKCNKAKKCCTKGSNNKDADQKNKTAKI